MKKRTDRAPGQRQLRVGEEIRHAIAALLERGDIRDPRLRDVPVTVTEVKVSSDLRHAQVYVVPLGGGDASGVLEAFGRVSPFIKRHIAKTVKLRWTPELVFHADDTFDQVDHIESLLRNPEVARDLLPREEEDDGT